MAKRATKARLLAAELTCKARQRSAYIRELLDTSRQTAEMPPEEFAFAQVLCFGVVMCQGTLDELIDRNLNSPRDIKPNVRDCLRISAYELLFLDKPEHVVVDQGVELVRATAKRATGLANAVLRKMARDARSFPWGDVDADDTAFARSFGMPLWLTTQLLEQYGRKQTRDMLAASLKSAPTYLHENPYTPGQTFASDLSAVFVSSLVPVGGRVLEIGAGRGTKTMLLQKRALSECGGPASIDAVDLHPYRVELLKKRMEEAGVRGVHAFAGDARDLSSIEGLAQSYPAVFVDAPCSGTGTLRRHPEIRWRLTPSDIDELAQLQLDLLREAASRVGRNGQLVYATCSVLRQENDEVVEAFLASEEGEGFVVEPIAQLGEEKVDVLSCWTITPKSFFASVPTVNGPDGHFAAVLRKAH